FENFEDLETCTVYVFAPRTDFQLRLTCLTPGTTTTEAGAATAADAAAGTSPTSARTATTVKGTRRSARRGLMRVIEGDPCSGEPSGRRRIVASSRSASTRPGMREIPPQSSV